MQELLALCDSYQSYPIVISSMRQLRGLCDSYQLYATVINPIRQLQKKNLLCHYWATAVSMEISKKVIKYVKLNQIYIVYKMKLTGA